MILNRKAFFDAYRAKWGALRQSQVIGLEALLGFNEQLPWPTEADFAYALATVKHECANTWKPVEEYGADSYFNRYEWNTRVGRNLGNTTPGDGLLYKGRGYVQITGRANYARASNFLGLDLVKNPKLALVPFNAYQIMHHGMLTGMFTGAKLSNYTDQDPPNFVGARRVINPGDRAQLVADYAVGLLACLDAALAAA